MAIWIALISTLSGCIAALFVLNAGFGFILAALSYILAATCSSVIVTLSALERPKSRARRIDIAQPASPEL